MNHLSRKRWLRYSLRTLLIVISISAVSFAYVSNRVREQWALAMRVEQLGGKVTWGRLQGDSWISVFARERLPQGYVDDVVAIDLTGSGVTDEDLERFRKFTHLRLLYLDDTSITDAGLNNLEHFKELAILSVFGTQISNSRLDRLKEVLPNLETTGPDVGDPPDK